MITQLDQLPSQPDRDEVTETLRELIAEFGLASIRHAIEDITDTDTDNTKATDLVRGICSLIASSKNPRLEADCIALSLGLGVRDGLSERKIAIMRGVSPAAVSARVRKFCQLTGYQLPSLCKAPDAVARYRKTNRSRHATIHRTTQ